MKTKVTIEIDTDLLRGYTDQHLASLWHVAQANPADSYADRTSGELAECIGREIIRRFLTQIEPELYAHQGHQFDWGQRHLKHAPPLDAEAILAAGREEQQNNQK